MDEILKKLLQSELLSEETKSEISEQWTTSVETFKTQVREEVSSEVRLELAEQWIAERDDLVEKVDGFIAEALTNEINELKNDIERFRDLEVEYAERIVEEKEKLAEEVASELDVLVDKLDAFLEMRLSSEISELKEDLEIVKQNEFGRVIYEAFAQTFSHVSDEKSVQHKLNVAEGKLQDVEFELSRLEEDRKRMIRETRLNEVLSPLTGKNREQMAMVLRNVSTNKLEESYGFFIGKILKEENESVSLNESARQKRTTLVTGEPTVSGKKMVSEELAAFRRIAGLE